MSSTDYLESHLRAAIQNSLQYHLYENAKFIAERLYAEYQNEVNAYVLAVCYFRSGQAQRSYRLIGGFHSLESRYLYAICCIQLGKQAEAEKALLYVINKQKDTSDVFEGQLVAPVYFQLATVCKISNRYNQAAEFFSKAFQSDPTMWVAYEELCQLGYEDMAKTAWESAKLNSQDYLIQQQLSPRQQQIQANNSSLTSSDIQHQKAKINIQPINDHQQNFLQQSQQYNQQPTKEAEQVQSDLGTPPQFTSIQRQLNFSVGKSNSSQPSNKQLDVNLKVNEQDKKRRNDSRSRRAYDKSVSDGQINPGSRRSQRIASQQQVNPSYNTVNINTSQITSQNISQAQNNSNLLNNNNNSFNQNTTSSLQQAPAPQLTNVSIQHHQHYNNNNSNTNNSVVNQIQVIQPNQQSPTHRVHSSYGRGSRDSVLFQSGGLQMQQLQQFQLQQQLDMQQQQQQTNITTHRSSQQAPDLSRDSFCEAWYSPRSQSERNNPQQQNSYNNMDVHQQQQQQYQQQQHQIQLQLQQDAQRQPGVQSQNVRKSSPVQFHGSTRHTQGEHNYKKQSKSSRSIKSLMKTCQISGERNMHGEAMFIHILTPAADGLRLLHAYKCKEALECFERLQFKQFSTGWAQCMLGRIYFEMYEYYSAVRMFETVRKIDSSRLQSMEVYSTVLWHLKRPVELSVLAQEALHLDRHSSYTWCIVGNCFSLQKEHESAIKCFNRSIQLDSNMTYAYTLCGHEYFANDDFEKAQQCFTQALAKNKRHINAWYGLGMIFYRQEKYDLAVNNFTVALQINPNSSILKCYLGMAQHKVGKLKEAQKYLDLSIQNDPRNCLSLYKKAGLLQDQGDHQGALKQLEQIKDLAPKEFAVYYQIGGIYKKLGRKDKALVMFNQALDLKPPQSDQSAIKQAIEKLNSPDDDLEYLN